MTQEAVEPKRRALGKGLESLLGSRPEAAAVAAAPDGKPFEIELGLIDRNPYQTRRSVDEGQLEELARSVAATGVVQPVIVRPLAGGRFQLIAGERRWMASQRAGKATIPAVVRHVSDAQALEMTIVENLQRSDLNAMEQAWAFERLAREFNMTQEEVASRTGKDRGTVAHYMRLLKLPNTVQASLERGDLSFGHAKALLTLKDDESVRAVAAKVQAGNLSVRQTELAVQGLLNPEGKAVAEPKERVVDPNVRDAEERLRRNLGLKVRIDDKNGRGRVVIEYSGIEDFDALLEALGGAV